jgi:hypothetical protein
MRRAAGWAGAGVLVVLAARTVAYALEPSPLARELSRGAGGPRLWVLATVVLALGAALATAVVWLAAIGVAERRRLERRRLVAPPRRVRVGRLLLRAAGLWGATAAGFALLESTLHWHAGLGWHGISCLTGPVHRDAIPILLALSLVAAACAEAAEHVTAWLRRTLARLAAAAPLFAPVPFAAARVAAPLALAALPHGARGPPLRSS